MNVKAFKRQDRRTSSWSSDGERFLSRIQNAITLKEKLDRFGHIKSKYFCSPKNTSKRMKRQEKQWQKMFATHITTNVSNPKRYKDHKCKRSLIQKTE